MKSTISYILLLFFISLLLMQCRPSSDRKSEIDPLERKIDSVLARMGLEEKIGQTAQRRVLSLENDLIIEETREAVRKGEVGSFLNVMNTDMMDELQRIAVEESHSGVPLLFGRDVIHGFRTVFPIPLGLAATWDPGLVEESAAIAAQEATTNGIRWTFAPMIDISRDARWGRIAESPGEDPYLASLMAGAYVKGFQGENLSSRTSIAACAKHYAGYGAAEGGRDYNSAIIYEQLLRDIYLAPFKAAKDAGVSTFMISFNDLNGVPASGNRLLLKTILRDEWDFDGFVVSDWESITEMIDHGFCTDERDAADKAANAGVDMEMVGRSYENHLGELIQEGRFSESQLDNMVRNILRIKFRLGLFENPYVDRSRDKVVLSDTHLATARKSAIQSLVLLKNKNNLLPLSDGLKKVAVIGPMADAPYEQLGTWSFDGDRKDTRTPLHAIREHLGKEKVLYTPGLAFSRDRSMVGYSQAVSVAKQADVILFFGGEEAILSGEAHSRADISLPGVQEDLIRELKKTGTPVVTVIMAGRPITVNDIIDDIDALMMAWHPGTMGGPAIADVLFGEAEPGGRLPVTWPCVVGQIPIYYNHPNTGRPPLNETFIPIEEIPIGVGQSSLGNTSHYLDAGYLPHFPFGYGLTYTTFDYRNLKLSDTLITLKDTLRVSVTVSNTGSREGTEVVQLYVRDHVGDIVRPVRELKGFQRVFLQPGEKKKICFVLHTDDLAFHNQDMEHVTEPGIFSVWTGRNAHEGLEGSFTIDNDIK